MSTSSQQRVKLQTIIKNLFQNEIITSNEMKQYYSFSKLTLTTEQIKQLTYPQTFKTMNQYILQQVDTWIGKNNSTKLTLISFIKNGDDYIYGCFFDIIDQERFKTKQLTENTEVIKLNQGVKFKRQDDYHMEVYENVLGVTVILNIQQTIGWPSLQISHCYKMHTESLKDYGITQSKEPQIKYLGLSTNLEL